MPQETKDPLVKDFEKIHGDFKSIQKESHKTLADLNIKIIGLKKIKQSLLFLRHQYDTQLSAKPLGVGKLEIFVDYFNQRGRTGRNYKRAHITFALRSLMDIVEEEIKIYSQIEKLKIEFQTKQTRLNREYAKIQEKLRQVEARQAAQRKTNVHKDPSKSLQTRLPKPASGDYQTTPAFGKNKKSDSLARPVLTTATDNKSFEGFLRSKPKTSASPWVEPASDDSGLEYGSIIRPTGGQSPKARWSCDQCRGTADDEKRLCQNCLLLSGESDEDSSDDDRYGWSTMKPLPAVR